MSIVSNHHPETIDELNGTVEASRPLRIYKPLEPATDNSKMVLWSPDTESVIEVDDAPYWMKLLWDRGRLVGVRLEKFGFQDAYDIDLTEPNGCDCPDATYRQHRPGGCKHVKAVRKLLKAKRLL